MVSKFFESEKRYQTRSTEFTVNTITAPSITILNTVHFSVFMSVVSRDGATTHVVLWRANATMWLLFVSDMFDTYTESNGRFDHLYVQREIAREWWLVLTLYVPGFNAGMW